MKLLTDAEVARVLRCSTVKVGRLRRSGALPYLPGRPVLVDEEALRRYVEERTIRHTPVAHPAAASETGAPSTDGTEAAAKARQRARDDWLRRARAGK